MSKAADISYEPSPAPHRRLMLDSIETLDGRPDLATTLDPPGPPSTPALARVATTDRIGRFVLLDMVGAGGMGQVFSAYDPNLDRRVAVKVLHDEDADPERAVRIRREAHALARVSHPNVVQVYDTGEVDGCTYIAMEFIDGRTLTEWAAERSHRWSDVVDMYVKVGSGLAAAHAAGLIHRDFKPANVLVGEDDRPRIIDFGLARAESAPAEAAAQIETAAPGVLESVLTESGSFLGTPAYMSPEQMIGQGVGPASDQFSFCVALYEALFGRPPFDDSSIINRLHAIEHKQWRRPALGTHVPRRIIDVLERGLAPAPDARWPSMTALLSALGWDGPDRAEGWRSRLGFFLLLWAGAIGVTGASVWFWPDGVPDLSTLALHGALAIGVSGLVVLRLRGILLATPYSRRLFAWLGTLLFGPFLVHLVGLMSDVPIGTGLALHIAASAMVSILAGFVVTRWAFGTAAWLCLGALWIASADAPLIPYGLTLTGTVVTGALGTWLDARRVGDRPDVGVLHAGIGLLTAGLPTRRAPRAPRDTQAEPAESTD